jgi:hypothetical protein
MGRRRVQARTGQVGTAVLFCGRPITKRETGPSRLVWRWKVCCLARTMPTRGQKAAVNGLGSMLLPHFWYVSFSDLALPHSRAALILSSATRRHRPLIPPLIAKRRSSASDPSSASCRRAKTLASRLTDSGNLPPGSSTCFADQNSTLSTSRPSMRQHPTTH